MNIPRRTAYIAGSLALMAAGIVVVFGILQDFQQRRQAEQLLDVVQQIRVGSTDHASVIQETLRFRHYCHEYRPADTLECFFYNKWLHRLRLAPHVEFRVDITFSGGIVADKRAWVMVSTTGCAAEVAERKHGFGVPDGFPIPPSHTVHAWPDGSGQHVWRIRIEDDDTYGESERRKEWTFDLACMTRIGPGCRDAREMLPSTVLPQLTLHSQRGSGVAGGWRRASAALRCENGQRNEVLNRSPSMSRYEHPRTGHRSRVAWLGSPCASRPNQRNWAIIPVTFPLFFSKSGVAQGKVAKSYSAPS